MSRLIICIVVILILLSFALFIRVFVIIIFIFFLGIVLFYLNRSCLNRKKTRKETSLVMVERNEGALCSKEGVPKGKEPLTSKRPNGRLRKKST